MNKLLLSWRDGVKVGMGFGFNANIDSQRKALIILHSKVDSGAYDMMYDDQHEYITLNGEIAESLSKMVDKIIKGANEWSTEELALQGEYAEALEIMLNERKQQKDSA